MVNLEPPAYPSLSLDSVAQGLYSPAAAYPPAPFMASPVSSTGAVQFSSPTPAARYQLSPVEMNRIPPQPELVLSAAHLVGNMASPPLGMPTAAPTSATATITTTANMSNMLMMDADTAIQSAPFVDLGRNSLPQDWSCVKIGNVGYPVSSLSLSHV